jgi:hypothetical protein
MDIGSGGNECAYEQLFSTHVAYNNFYIFLAVCH